MNTNVCERFRLNDARISFDYGIILDENYLDLKSCVCAKTATLYDDIDWWRTRN